MSIKLRSVSKSLREKEILSRVTFDISDGEILIIKGKDEEAKTTLLNILDGVSPISNGSITISGYDISEMKRKERAVFFRNTIGFVPEGTYLQPNLNVRGNLSLPGVFAGLNKRENESRIRRVSKRFGFSKESLKQKVSVLSFADKKNLCVARACFMNPNIILADKLTDELENENAEIIMQKILDFAKETGATIIIASNDNRIEQYATKVVTLKSGKIVETEEEK